MPRCRLAPGPRHRCCREAVGGKLSQPSKHWGDTVESRFLQLSEVAEELAVSDSQVYHMVRSGELPAIKIGGRGQWRVERVKLEEYIARKYTETAEWVQGNPLVDK
ncbi:excisionase family DNA binding protein [Asanoa ferruginea]|uniref:Excisionase family DNA binding protein n=1 Tax=Asanoa ferruginea TaxID=53367 RepID=A0A3D9ZGN0_9ACTN|nr:excisionase family DNA binding protein [Asanoa ferruginea]